MHTPAPPSASPLSSDTSVPAPGADSRRSPTYENRLLVVLALGGAVAALDAQALFYLSPFVATDLRLSNSQIGVVASIVLLTWSFSGYAIGAVSDRTGRRKPYLVAAFALFGVCSFLSGLATTFAFLLASRVLIGVAEGPVIPLSQSIMIQESSPHRRGFNMGIVQNLGAQLFGSLLGPIVLVKIASTLDWHAAFYVAGIPGLIVAGLVLAFVREPANAVRVASKSADPRPLVRQLAALFAFRNLRLCVLISCCIVAWYFLLLTFLPLYCVRVLRISPTNMSLVMGASGAAGVVSAILVPALSDRFGRKPAMIVFAACGVLAALGPLYVQSSGLPAVIALVFAGSLALGTAPLFMATIPLETVPTRDAAAATGLVMGLGQIIGGFCGPALGGMLADRFDLSVPLWIAAGAAVSASLLSMSLKESAPERARARLTG